MPTQPMSPLLASIAATAGAALLSAVVVLVFEGVLLDRAHVAAQPLSPLAAAVAMALFAVVTGAISTGFAALFERWFHPGLAIYAIVVLAIAILLSRLALATTPTEAPMYIVLHVVFVIAFGIAIPLAWYRA